MALSTSGRKRGIMAEINITPLTDVFLVTGMRVRASCTAPPEKVGRAC